MRILNGLRKNGRQILKAQYSSDFEPEITIDQFPKLITESQLLLTYYLLLSSLY